MSVERLPSIRPQALFGLAAVLGGLLLALLAVELVDAAGRVSASQPVRARPGAASDARPADVSALLPPGTVLNEVRVAQARPLFSPQRRPPSVAVSGPQRPRLAGIIVGAAGTRAIFAGSGDARGSVVGVGQQAGAWRVLAISGTGVRVSGPDGVRTLHPSRDSSAGGTGGDTTTPQLPAHPSILDLLRNRNAGPRGGGLLGAAGPQIVPLQFPQQTAPAAPE